jgi:hypothetical protein
MYKLRSSLTLAFVAAWWLVPVACTRSPSDDFGYWRPSELHVAPSSATLQLNQAVTFRASIFDGSEPVVRRHYTWSVRDTMVARIVSATDSTVTVRAIATGSTGLICTVTDRPGLTGGMSIVVQPQ